MRLPPDCHEYAYLLQRVVCQSDRQQQKSTYYLTIFGLQRQVEEEVTFEALKKVLAEPAESRREAEYEKRQMICEKFRNTPFQQLVASSQSKVCPSTFSLLFVNHYLYQPTFSVG